MRCLPHFILCQAVIVLAICILRLYPQTQTWTTNAFTALRFAGSLSITTKDEESAVPLTSLPVCEHSFALSLPPVSPEQTVVYVSCDGSDDNIGTSATAPLLTLNHTLSFVSFLLQQTGRVPRIRLAPCHYPLTAGLLISADISGRTDEPLIIEATADVTTTHRHSPHDDVSGLNDGHRSSTAVLMGGRMLLPECFTRIGPSSNVSRVIAESVLSAVIAIHLPTCLSLSLADLNLSPLTSIGFSEPLIPSHSLVFSRHTPLTLARWPNEGEDWLRTGTVHSVGSIIRNGETDRRPFTFQSSADAAEHMRRWQQHRGGRSVDASDEVWMMGYWTYDWAEQSVQIDSVRFGDNATANISSAQPSHYGVKEARRYYFYNILDELDAPGEYYIDRQTGWLYVIPPLSDHRHGVSDSELSIALMTTPLITFDHVSNVILRGLTLELTRGTAVRIIGGDHLVIDECVIRRIGNVGVMCGYGAAPNPTYRASVVDVDIAGSDVVGDMGPAIYHRNFIDTLWNRECGTHHTVTRTHIHHTGAGGIIMGGGDRLTLTSGHNRIVNNHIHTFSTLWHTYRPAIWHDGVGGEIAHNRIWDGPHAAVLLNGNDHVVELNDISHVCQETSDVGAIYIGRDWTQRGHVIRHNFLHHISGLRMTSPSQYERVGIDSNAIYFDDLSSGSSVIANIFYRVQRAVFIGGGRDFVVQNNVMIQVEVPVHIDSRALNSHKGLAVSEDATIYKRLKRIPFDTGVWAERYPLLSTMLANTPAAPLNNEVTANVFLLCGKLRIVSEVDRTRWRNWRFHSETRNTSANETPIAAIAEMKIGSSRALYCQATHNQSSPLAAVDLYDERSLQEFTPAMTASAVDWAAIGGVCAARIPIPPTALRINDSHIAAVLSAWKPIPNDMIGPCCVA